MVLYLCCCCGFWVRSFPSRCSPLHWYYCKSILAAWCYQSIINIRRWYTLFQLLPQGSLSLLEREDHCVHSYRPVARFQTLFATREEAKVFVLIFLLTSENVTILWNLWVMAFLPTRNNGNGSSSLPLSFLHPCLILSSFVGFITRKPSPAHPNPFWLNSMFFLPMPFLRVGLLPSFQWTMEICFLEFRSHYGGFYRLDLGWEIRMIIPWHVVEVSRNTSELRRVTWLLPSIVS